MDARDHRLALPPHLLIVAKVVKPLGISGGLGVLPFAPDSETLLHAHEIDVITPDGQRTTRRVKSAAPRGTGLMLCLEGVCDRGAAEGLRGALVAVDRQTISLAPNEVFVADLEGMQAFDSRGRDLGVVKEVLHLPAHDVLVLDLDGQERMVPLVPAFFLSVDLAARTLVLEPPEED